MRLVEYLERTGESQAAFARRAQVPTSTVNLICNGGGARSKTARKIIQATGGLVKLEDLEPATSDKGSAGASAA